MNSWWFEVLKIVGPGAIISGVITAIVMLWHQRKMKIIELKFQLKIQERENWRQLWSNLDDLIKLKDAGESIGWEVIAGTKWEEIRQDNVYLKIENGAWDKLLQSRKYIWYAPENILEKVNKLEKRIGSLFAKYWEHRVLISLNEKDYNGFENRQKLRKEISDLAIDLINDIRQYWESS